MATELLREKLEARQGEIYRRLIEILETLKPLHSARKVLADELEALQSRMDELAVEAETLHEEHEKNADDLDNLNEETGEGFATVPVERIEGGAR